MMSDPVESDENFNGFTLVGIRVSKCGTCGERETQIDRIDALVKAMQEAGAPCRLYLSHDGQWLEPSPCTQCGDDGTEGFHACQAFQGEEAE